MKNWRPINLQATQYKIYAALISRRLVNKAFSPNKKGFLPVDGCLEHTFLLQRKNVSMVWLHLQDAFRSIPHTTLFTMIERAGLDKTDEGLLTPSTITKGMKQG